MNERTKVIACSLKGAERAQRTERWHALGGYEVEQLHNGIRLVFANDVEHKLQMVNDAQTHSLPRDHEELTTCARLLGYSDAEPFLRDYQHHTGHVNLIFERRVRPPA